MLIILGTITILHVIGVQGQIEINSSANANSIYRCETNEMDRLNGQMEKLQDIVVTAKELHEIKIQRQMLIYEIIQFLKYLGVTIPDPVFKARIQKPFIQILPRNCAEAYISTKGDGIYKLKISEIELEPFYAYCVKQNNEETAWTVIQNRFDGSVDFYNKWDSYAKGIGHLGGEFFLGLKWIHALTIDVPHELRIELEDFAGNKRYAYYDHFAIGNEEEKFPLIALGNYSGTAGDSLTPHAGQFFSTPDNDNDVSIENCAFSHSGAWWFNSCANSNLNGVYYAKGVHETKSQNGTGIEWDAWQEGNTTLFKTTRMLIRALVTEST